MIDIQAALNRKYAVQETQARAAAQEAQAKADLAQQQMEFNRRTSVPGSSVYGMAPSFLSQPAESKSDTTQEKTPGQGPGQTTDTSTSVGTGTNLGVGSTVTGVRNVSSLDDISTKTLDDYGITATSSGMGMFGIPGRKKGIARVPGKGDGTKDTVPSMLAPGEAVLNKAAADKMGRGLIAALNKMGAQKMGLV